MAQSLVLAAGSYVFVAKIGASLPFSNDGVLCAPKGIALDSSGNLYVADTNNNRIQKFDSSGTFLTKWGSQGSADSQFDHPRGIALDSSGNVYVADTDNNRIQKFAYNEEPVQLTLTARLGSTYQPLIAAARRPAKW